MVSSAWKCHLSGDLPAGSRRGRRGWVACSRGRAARSRGLSTVRADARVAGDGRGVRRRVRLGLVRGVAAACGGCGQETAGDEHRRAARRPPFALGAGEPGDPGYGERCGDVEVQPQAQEMLGGVDPQRLLEDPVCRVAGHIQREQPGRADRAVVAQPYQRRGEARSKISSYRNVGWNVACWWYPAGRCDGEIASAHGRVAGRPNSSWLK